MKTLKQTIITTLAILGLAVIALIATIEPAYAATNVTVKAGQVKTVKTARNTKLVSKNKSVVAVNNKKIMGKRAGKTTILVKKGNKTINKINVTVTKKYTAKKSSKCAPGCHDYSLKRKTVVDKAGYVETMTMEQFEAMAGCSYGLDQEYIEVRHPEESHDETYLECSKCHDVKTR